MGWYPNADGRDMSADLDNWITGHWGEDQFKDERFCKDCSFYDDGMCCNKTSPLFEQTIGEEEYSCDFFDDKYDTSQDEPFDFDLRRCMND